MSCRFLVAAMIVVVVAFLPAASIAHAALLSTSPDNGLLIDDAPDAVSLTFNEPVSPLRITLITPGGESRELTGIPGGVVVVIPAGVVAQQSQHFRRLVARQHVAAALAVAG